MPDYPKQIADQLKALTTQARRIADAVTAPVEDTPPTADDAPPPLPRRVLTRWRPVTRQTADEAVKKLLAEEDPTAGRTYVEVSQYQPDRGGTAWAWRCWGDGACDGYLSLGHGSRNSARAGLRLHLMGCHGAIDAHTAGAHSIADAVQQALRADRSDFALVPAPADDEALREQYAEALAQRTPSLSKEDHLELGTPDAVLTVRDRHMEQLAAELAEWRRQTEIADSVTARTKELLARRTETLRTRAEQAEATIARVRQLADAWAVMRTYGSAASELRTVLDGPSAPVDAQRCTQHPNAPAIGGKCGGCTTCPADLEAAKQQAPDA